MLARKTAYLQCSDLRGWNEWCSYQLQQRTRGLSSHPCCWTEPPPSHSECRLAFLPHSGQTRASCGSSRPRWTCLHPSICSVEKDLCCAAHWWFSLPLAPEVHLQVVLNSPGHPLVRPQPQQSDLQKNVHEQKMHSSEQHLQSVGGKRRNSRFKIIYSLAGFEKRTVSKACKDMSGKASWPGSVPSTRPGRGLSALSERRFSTGARVSFSHATDALWASPSITASYGPDTHLPSRGQ